MSTYERKTTIEDPRIGPSWEVTYHEIRGYDSPDRWHEVRFKGKLVEQFGHGPRERERAIKRAMGPSPKSRYQRLRESGPPEKLQVTVASDDLITYAWGDKTEEVGSPEMDFRVKLPDGTVIPLKADYSSWGWQFTLELPAGTEVEPVPPPDEDDE